MGINLGITGISSTMGKVLVKHLENDDRIDKIKGLDIREPNYESDLVQYVKGDVRNKDDLNKCFKECDVIIHMAFKVFVVPKNRQQIEDININGSKNVFQTTAEMGINKIIYISSVASYGHHTERDVSVNPIKEDDEKKGDEHDFFYFYTKGVVEKFLDKFQTNNPDIVISRLRPHIIAGQYFLQDTNNLRTYTDRLSGSSYSSLYPQHLEKHRRQLTHEDDLAETIKYCIFNDVNEAINVAGDPLELPEYLSEKGIELKTPPYWLARIIVKVRSWFDEEAKLMDAWFPAMKYPILVDNSKIKEFIPDIRSTKQIMDEIYESIETD